MYNCLDEAYAKYDEAERHYKEVLQQMDGLGTHTYDKYDEAKRHYKEALQQLKMLRQKHAPSWEKVNGAWEKVTEAGEEEEANNELIIS